MCDHIIRTLTNRSLQTITNVYQLQFVDFKPPGFGDYIRGCFTLCQIIHTVNEFCGTNIAFDMDLRNHPLCRHIVIENTDDSVNYPAIGNFHIDVLKVAKDVNDIAFQHILTESIKYVNKLRVPNFYTFCCKYEIYYDIAPADKARIRAKLVPNAAMNALIDGVLGGLSLVSGEYSVIHVRCNDEVSFPPKDMPAAYLETIRAKVLENTPTETAPHLLVSNNDQVKVFLRSANIVTAHYPLCHLGQDTAQSAEETQNTMLDFFLLSRAKNILAFSEYGHGTGFSEECAKLYDVPYTCIKLPLLSEGKN